MEKIRNHITEEYWIHDIVRHDGWTTLPVIRDTTHVSAERIHLSRTLSDNYTSRLQQLCKDDEVNIYAFLFSAFARVLSVYTGKKRILTSVPCIRVREKDFNDDTLFWGTEVDLIQPFKAFFMKNREKLPEILNHATYDRSHVWQKLEARNLYAPAANPVAFLCANAWVPSASTFGFQVQTQPNLVIHIHARRDSYGQSAAQNFLDSFFCVLHQLLDEPGKQLGEYTVYEPHQIQTLLATCQGVEKKYTEKNILELFDHQLRNVPDQIALLHKQTALSYQHLHQKACSLAHLLQQRYQPMPYDVVGILLENPEDLLVSMLGVLQAGAAYAILPLSDSVETQTAMLKNAHARVLITDSQGMFQLSIDGIGLIAIDIELEASEPMALPDTHPDSLAMVCFEEGQPDNLIRLTHGQVINLIKSTTAQLDVTATDRILSVWPYHTRLSMHQTWLSLLTGTTLVARDEPGNRTAAQLEACIRQHQIRLLAVTMSDLIHLKTVLPVGIVRTVWLPLEDTFTEDTTWLQQAGVRTVYAYGQHTPIGIASLYEPGSEMTHTKNRTIGTPLNNTRVLLLDAHLLPVPVGVAGEIYLEMPAIHTPHKLDIPEHTLVSPFDTTRILYKTTDIGRCNADGCIEWVPLYLNPETDAGMEPDELELSEAALPQDKPSQLLVEWCRHILGVEKVYMHHDFFMLGGDSIKAIDLISKLGRSGYELDLRDVFRHRTMRNIAANLRPAQGMADQALVTGAVPLMPIQRKFFSFATNKPQHFNQAFMFFSEERLEEKTVKEMVRTLQTHHDALRMSYRIKKDSILQVNRGVDYPVSVTTHDLRKEKDPAEAFLKACNQLQQSIDLARGPLLKIGLFHLPDGDRLLLTLHHLVVDIISWKIIFEDIALLMMMYQTGKRLSLPPKTNAYKLWAEKVEEYVQSGQLAEEKPYWEAIENQDIQPIPKDFPQGSMLVRDIRRQSVSLSPDETAALLVQANQRYQASMNEVILTALGLSLSKTFGTTNVLLELERHGREPLFEGVDVSRTVGWFTSVYPFVVEIPTTDPLVLVRTVRDQFARIPNGGIGYGMLKYMPQPASSKPMTFRLKAQASFNFLGEFQTGGENQSIHLASEPTGDTLDPELQVPHELDISGMIIQKTLTLVVSYSEKQYRFETIQKLLAACQAELVAMSKVNNP